LESTRRGTLGDHAEQLAYSYLSDAGLRAVARNFRTRGGEIDLIMLDRDCLVFVEVRCRRSALFTDPGHTVDLRKQRKIIRTAALFCARNRRYGHHAMRFDVIAITGDDPPLVRWIQDAFRPNDSVL
jgi:putative endonuclease